MMCLFKQSSISFSELYDIAINEGYGVCHLIHTDKVNLNKCIGGFTMFDIEESEIAEFDELCNMYLQINNKYEIDNLIDVYMSARPVYSREVKQVLYVTTAEMIIDSGVEISHRLARAVAVLLGNNKEDSAKIYKKFKKIYDARSKYVHSGVRENAQDLLKDTEEISRKIILELIKINFNTDKDIKTISKELNELGYGERNIIFES